MEITPDSIVFWQHGVFKLNATILFTWIVMGILALLAWLTTRRATSATRIPRWQNGLEAIIEFMRRQIAEMTPAGGERLLPFVGSLFLFISLSNLLAVVPRYHPPTGSLSTTSALAACVFVATPVFGVLQTGAGGYLRHFVTPTWIMLPFQVISEISRTVALALRLFGNVMSGTMVIAVLLMVVPLFAPVALHLLELLIGQVQAFIFAVLATAYVASGADASR